MEHEHLIKETLDDLTISIVEYIYKYHNGYKFSLDLLKDGGKLIQSIESKFKIIVYSIINKLTHSINKCEEFESMKLLNLFEFTFSKLINLENTSEPE